MLNSLDLLVISFMVIAALSLLSVLLMFLIKNKIVRRISLGITVATALYTSAMGLYIALYGFLFQGIIAVLTGFAAIGAIVLEVLGAKLKGDKFSLIARITAAAALVISVINAVS